MTIESTLYVKYDGKDYEMLVKMIRVEMVSYFHIRNKNGHEQLLTDGQLVLCYDKSFTISPYSDTPAKTPKDVIVAIQDAILSSRSRWFIDGK